MPAVDQSPGGLKLNWTGLDTMMVFDESPEEIIMSRFAPGPTRVTVTVININLLPHDVVDNYAKKISIL